MDIIEKQLKEFINNKEPNVYALRGSWGVGKTFTWEKIINDADNYFAFEKYSYVSLFGINSLSALKSAIFENTINIQTEENKDTEKKERKFSIPLRKASKFIPQLPYLKEISAPFDYIAFNCTKDTLICFDDIERRSEGLEIKEIFGLCNYLKEKKGCKIVIILNDDEISDTEGKIIDYKKYREKIIDVDLLLQPTPKECNSIVFEKKYPNLQKNCELLNITNIRILKKIKKMYEDIIKCSNDINQTIIEQIENSLPLYMYCFYSGSESIPSLEYVTKNLFMEDSSKLEEKEQIKHKNWNNFINSGNYQFTDRIDLVLAHAVQQGFVNKDELMKEINSKTNELDLQNKSKAFIDAMADYKYSFDGNPDEIIQNIINTTKENISNITRQNLDEVVRLMRDLEKEQNASELIELWIDAHKETIGCFDLSENDYIPEVRDIEIINRFKEIFNKHYIEVEKSLEKIIQKLTHQEGVDDTDLFILQNVPIDELVNIIKSLKRSEIQIYVKFIYVCKNCNDWKKYIYEHSIEAFKKIGDESKLNKIRLKYWGIEF